MGEITVRLVANARTGEREVIVSYESDDDWTQAEHEERHRRIVEALAVQGVISREDEAHVRFEPLSGQAAAEAEAEDRSELA
ncbi:MAG TPA: hypothetical protein DCZ72_01370 [Armatimonadetes bacterium]|nr:hypothetical protein [Armatimonadota bacterium]